MSIQKNRILIGIGIINLVASGYVISQPPSLNKLQLEGKLFELYGASVAGLWGAFALQDRITIEDAPTDNERISSGNEKN